MSLDKEPQLPKPGEVCIKSFQVLALPNPISGIVQMVWGLGEDDKMYLWDSQKKVWLSS